MKAESDEESIRELECEEEETRVPCRWARVPVQLLLALGLRDSISVRRIPKASHGVAHRGLKPRARSRSKCERSTTNSKSLWPQTIQARYSNVFMYQTAQETSPLGLWPVVQALVREQRQARFRQPGLAIFWLLIDPASPKATWARGEIPQP